MKHSKKESTDRYARGEHVMNGNESKVMRQLQAKTGMTKEEIRKHKKYRIMLSAAQKPANNSQLRNYLAQKEILTFAAYGSTKAMFMQKVSTFLNNKEMVTDLYKRYSGGLVDERRPTTFCYRKFSAIQNAPEVLSAIYKTEGRWVYSVARNEVGFAHKEDMLMFTLVYVGK